MRCDETMYFFDSWGRPHETCEPSWHGAQAFGPTGTARPLSPSECPDERAFEGTGLVVVRDDEWSVLDGHTVETDVVYHDSNGRHVVPVRLSAKDRVLRPRGQ